MARCKNLSLCVLLLFCVAAVQGFAGISMGEYNGWAPTKNVMLIDGSATVESWMMFRPRMCDEVVSKWVFAGMSDKVLKAEDIMLSSELMETSDVFVNDACSTVAYNLTIENTFSNFPGYTALTVVLITTNSVGTNTKYTFSLSYVVSGLVLYTEEKGSTKIISGEGNAWELGNFKKINKDRTKVAMVKYQTSNWAEADQDSISLELSDTQSEEWMKYVDYDTSSCPAVFLDYKKKGKKPTFESEGGKCMLGFSNDLAYFFMRMNFMRVGCGGFQIKVLWPGLSTEEGEEFYTTINVVIGMDIMPPVVVGCAKKDVDHYGYMSTTFKAYNVILCPEYSIYQEKIDAKLPVGDAEWVGVNYRFKGADTYISFGISDFTSTKANSSEVIAGIGKILYEQNSGEILEVPTVSFCEDTDEVGDTVALYHEATLAENHPLPEDVGPDETVVEVQIEVPIVQEEFSHFRDGLYTSVMGNDMKLRKSKNIVSSRMQTCDGPMCTLRNFVSDRLNSESVVREEVTTATYLYQAVVSVDDNDAVITQLTELKDYFDTQVNAVPGKVPVITYVGKATNMIADQPTNDTSSTSRGFPVTFVGIIVAGVVGLMLLLLAIVYVVLADRDEVTTESDWSEGGVSVEGVPVPSSRFYDAVVVDGYGRGDVPGELHVERPNTAITGARDL